MSDQIIFKPLSEIRDLIQKRDVKCEEVTRAFLEQTEKQNSNLNAYITVNERALDSAKAMDLKLPSGRLVGVPLAIKDLLCTKGMKTTAASHILHNFIPPYSSTVVARLEKDGAITLGKTNLDEFAMGSSNENSFYGPCKNPWDPEHVPGGSSGGSAVAVSAGMAAAAIGTDTGGSIRQPANFCGIVGLKPTYGRVSRYGIIAFASSLDQAGPMTRTVRDAALILESIAGHDPYDATTAQEAVPNFASNLKDNIKGLKVGLPKEYYSDELSADTRACVDTALAAVKSRGAQIVEVSIPLTQYAVPIYYLVATSEASSNLARYDGVRFGYRSDFSKVPAADLEDFYSRTRGEGFGEEVKRRIMLGTYALSSGYYDAFYLKACQVRRLLRDQFQLAFKSCDVLLAPVTASAAFKIGERISDPLQMYLNDIFTTSINLVGMPGISVPAGFSSSGLPVGVQILAPHFAEQTMLNVAQSIEQELDIWRKIPHGLQ